MKGLRACIVIVWVRSLQVVRAFSASPTRTPQLNTSDGTKNDSDEDTFCLDGDWNQARAKIVEPDCCIVTKIDGIQDQLGVLKDFLVDQGPADLDLRARIRTSCSVNHIYNDCLDILEQSSSEHKENDDLETSARALHELAIGVASLTQTASSSLQNCDVFCRIVCASNYRAREPPMHTDKAPLRAYATLQGVGTEYLPRICTPWEYARLRTLGPSKHDKNLQQAQEKQFIVMKGDTFYDYFDSSTIVNSLYDQLWTRSRACVHRSPPGNHGRRIIVSFDLNDGMDEREWRVVGKRRKWRNGLTQRKSKLVA